MLSWSARSIHKYEPGSDHVFRLPDELRGRFRDPFGPVFTTDQLRAKLSRKDSVVAIGDVVSQTVLDLGFEPKVIIVDYKTQRGKLEPELKQRLSAFGQTVIRVQNPPATVSRELYVAVDQALRMAGTVRIEVEGEEDLAGLPVFALAKEGTVVLYGMPGRGVVYVKLDDTMRRISEDLLDRMRDEE